MIYATRSILPSKTANSVQSAHMAKAWEYLLPQTQVVYRTKLARGSAAEHFLVYGLEAPSKTVSIPVRMLDDCFHFYLLSFALYLKNYPVTTLIYTRSARMAWVASRMGRRVVLELHDPLIPIRKAFIRKYMRLGQIKLLVVTTERLKSDVIGEVGIKPEKILVAGGAAASGYVDVPAISLDQSLEAGIQVGYAGSALRGKGVAMVLACAHKMPEVTFHLIGPNRAQCEEMGGLSSNVVLHGYLEGSQVIAILKAMDILLLPNQASVIIRSGADIGQHTSPLKLFEYMATGRPIIVSDLPVFDGVLTDSENSLRVPPTDVDGFCRAIRRLGEDTDLAQKIASKALIDFKDKYTWEHRVRSIVRFIEDHDIEISCS